MGPYRPLFSSLTRAARATTAISIALVGSLTGGIGSTTAFAQTPCADMIGLLDALQTPSNVGSLQYVGGYGAFFPRDSFYTGKSTAAEDRRCHFVIQKDGSQIVKVPILVHDVGTVFQRFQPYGQSPTHKLNAPGKYAFQLLLDGKSVTSLPFEVTEKKSGDPFNPATTYSIDSDLLKWAVIEVSHSGSQRRVGVIFRLPGGELPLPRGARIDVSIEHQGRVVYEGGQVSGAPLESETGWHKFSKSLTQPSQRGGGFLPYEDFVKIDGSYRLVLRFSGEALRAWEYQVKDGAIVPHPRSGFDHEPRSDYLLSRNGAESQSGYSDLFWMAPLADPNAGVEAPAPVAFASASTRAAWKPVVAAPERKPAVVVTNIAARVDAHLAAGDGIVVFGTGANDGVAYLECGDDAEKSIPGGADFSARAFFCCGKKIVLLKRTQVFVYDTASGVMTEIPLDDITLMRSPTEMLKGRYIDADGMLVAVVCDPTKTADRRSIKVLDLSADAPRIIALGFPDAEPNQLANIAVDAAGGNVVVGSDRKSCLFAAPIAKNAQFRAIDLAGHDGFPKDCAPIVRDGRAVVFDSTGSRRLRVVDLASGTVKALGPLGQALQHFAFDGARVAFASDESYGSTYEIRIGAADGSPVAAPTGTGESSSYGKAGFGQRVALTSEGLVFTSGDGKGGISRGEVLLVSDGAAWHEVQRGGEALPAVDATLGTHVLAFKTGKARDARVGYVWLGAGMSGAGLAVE